MDIDSINFQDEKVWGILCEGKTRGVFQCESKLVQHWLRKIQPKNLWELSIVIAIVRPGALESGMADMLVDNKHSEKLPSFGNPIVDQIFESTFGILAYQENLMQLGMRLAWSHLPEKERGLLTDTLRKAVGKKNQKKILEIGAKFLEGCDHNKIPRELSNKLFEIIKNSGRYLFNLSHSFAYCVIAYILAYLKVHHPQEFFVVYLSYAQFKQGIAKYKGELHGKWKEIYDMITDSSTNWNIRVLRPDINKWNYHFQIEGEHIRYGLSHIKYVSQAVLEQTFALRPNFQFAHWSDVVKLGFTDVFGKSLRSNTLTALISVGAFSAVKESRNNLLAAINFFNELTPKEIEGLEERLTLAKQNNLTIAEFKSGLQTSLWHQSVRKTRIIKVDSQLKMWETNLKDSASWLENTEMYYLGYPLTCTRLDEKRGADHQISECAEPAAKGTLKRLHVKIADIRQTVTKTGKNPGQEMAIITVIDSSGEMKIPIFPELYASTCDLLIPQAIVAIDLVRGDKDYFASSVESLAAQEDSVSLEYQEE